MRETQARFRAGKAPGTKAIVSVIGRDKTGIISKVSHVLAECGVNIVDLSQTVLKEYFTMFMLVDLKHATVSFTQIQDALEARGEEIGMSMRIQPEDALNAM